MSSGHRLIINCGASSVTAAVISLRGTALHLEKLFTEDLDYDFSNDEAWLEALTFGLRDLVSANGLSGPATLILPGGQLLTKTLKVPHVENAKRAQVIAFEAQQNIPYPMHEVVWDSQVVGDDGVETEILFIACKSDAIDQFCRNVAGAGITATSIGAATVLDYNALRFAYPEIEDDVLLINIGARSTNLLFCGSDGFYIRNIALGGNSLTQAIADGVGKRFSQAEEIKKAFFERQEEFDDGTPGARALTTSTESFMRRMGQEIARSIVNYRRQKKGNPPKKILLTGRGSLMSGLSEYLLKTQKVEVEYFDPLRSVELDGSIALDLNVAKLQLSEIIGEAVRGAVPESTGVNLLPEEIQEAMAFRKKKPFILAAAACIAIAPFPVFLAKQNVAAAYEKQTEAINSFVKPQQAISNQIYAEKDRAVALSEAISRVEGIKNSKSNWIQFFAELQRSLVAAQDVWIDELRVNRTQSETKSTYEVVLEGQMLIRASVDVAAGSIDREAILQNIEALRSSLENSVFIASSGEPVLDWTMMMNEGLNVLPFQINLVVDPAKPL